MAGVKEEQAYTVTRVEIIDAVETAFVGSSATKQDIITAAIQQDSRTDVLSTLDRLPDRSFRHVRELWAHLPELPFGD